LTGWTVCWISCQDHEIDLKEIWLIAKNFVKKKLKSFYFSVAERKEGRKRRIKWEK
jgi:hypothetical protein